MSENGAVQPAPTGDPKEVDATVDIRRVGFFHFARDFGGDPIKSLDEALDQFLKKEDGRSDQVDAPKRLRESLLVVPEAFNLRLDIGIAKFVLLVATFGTI
jgi:hypothetical protein